MKLKFITLNFWCGKLIDNALEFLKQENPDILVLQEVFAEKNLTLEKRFRAFELIKKDLCYPYAAIAPAFLEVTPVGKIEHGNGTFSRYPIESTNVIFYDIPYQEIDKSKMTNFSFEPRNLQHVVIYNNGIKINIFNTQRLT